MASEARNASAKAGYARATGMPLIPTAILPQNQRVSGVERSYVDFDKCISCFVEAASCGIGIAECPRTRPAARPKLLQTMASRLHLA